MGREPHFEAELFEFLAELEANNDRDWFQANRDRYRTVVQEPLLGFIADFAASLRTISPRFVADPRPSGGSMFRIYRDVRFSRDKRPYKTVAAAQFRHEKGRDVHAPGFYLHLERGKVFAGMGLWRPAGATLGAVREAMVDSPRAWKAAVTAPAFAATLELGGDSLKRAPRGYDLDHPLMEDLKRKDLVAARAFADREVLEPGFLDAFADTCRAGVPFMRFLTEAIGLEFE